VASVTSPATSHSEAPSASWLTDELRHTSRTFALSIETLPSALRYQLTTGYLLLRVSDFLEDHHQLSQERKRELLLLWDSVLAGESSLATLLEHVRRETEDETDPERRLTLRAAELLGALKSMPEPVQEAILRRVRETTRGMAEWQRKGPRVRTEAELDEYMHYVAGLVGYLVADLSAVTCRGMRKRLSTLYPLAHECGLALQSVNVVRGLREDYERGWIFVPESYCRQHGLSQTELFSHSKRDASLGVLEQLVRKAEGHLHNGLRYVLTIPRRYRRVRLACAWPVLFAAATLAKSQGNAHAFAHPVKITRKQVKRIVLVSSSIWWSNALMHRYFTRLLSSQPAPSDSV